MTQPIEITISKDSVFVAQVESVNDGEFIHTIELTKEQAKPLFETLKNTWFKDENKAEQNKLIEQMAAQVSLKVLPKNISGRWLAGYLRSFKRI